MEGYGYESRIPAVLVTMREYLIDHGGLAQVCVYTSLYACERDVSVSECVRGEEGGGDGGIWQCS